MKKKPNAHTPTKTFTSAPTFYTPVSLIICYHMVLQKLSKHLLGVVAPPLSLPGTTGGELSAAV